MESYKHTPIVHFAAEGKILLFGKSGFGKERVCADIVDVQELTSQGPSGGDSPWMAHFFEMPHDTMRTQLKMEAMRHAPQAPSTNPRDNYTNTFWIFAPGRDDAEFPPVVSYLSSVRAIGRLPHQSGRNFLDNLPSLTDGTYGRSGKLSDMMCSGMPAGETHPACKSNDTLVAARYLVNYHFMRFMVQMTCTNKIEELKKIRQKVHVNSAEILALYVEWKRFANPERWYHHTASFPKLCSAVNFVWHCVCFDEGTMKSRVAQLKKDYEPNSSDDAEGEDESCACDSDSDHSNAATENSL